MNQNWIFHSEIDNLQLKNASKFMNFLIWVCYKKSKWWIVWIFPLKQLSFQLRLLIMDHSVYRRVEELRNLKIMMMYVISLWRSLFVTKVLLEQKNGRSFLPVRHILESIVEFSLIYHIVITYYENYFFLSLIILLLHSAKVVLC